MKMHEQETHAGKCLHAACQIYGTSFADLAKHLGVSRQHVHNMQNVKRINDDRVEQLAKYFRMSKDEFLNLSNKPATAMYRKAMESVQVAIAKSYNDPRHDELLAHSRLVEKLITELE